jgi:hypothetical protein
MEFARDGSYRDIKSFFFISSALGQALTAAGAEKVLWHVDVGGGSNVHQFQILSHSTHPYRSVFLFCTSSIVVGWLR